MRKSLTKKQIVSKKSDISHIFKDGAAVSVRGAKLIYTKNDLGYSRIIIIPARKFGNAVERNTVKRKLKELFRTEIDCLVQGYDLACIVYPGRVYDYNERRSQFYELIGKAGLLI
ncbi:MAG: ribonuclease P protein component [Spirochaetia bacterium]|jgi:ribonuclease P protein component|nr:ribonuclease P protein component [Spirochaetia bacterium]MCF7940284.1 ribonuclease P protein component [Spirochaetia bacterium]